MKYKRIEILLSICFVLLLLPANNFSSMNVQAVDNYVINITNIKPEISASVINPLQTAVITYSDIGANFDINDCSYQTTGVDVISMTQNYDVLEFRVQPTTNEGFGELKIHIEGESEEKLDEIVQMLYDSLVIINTEG